MKYVCYGQPLGARALAAGHGAAVRRRVAAIAAAACREHGAARGAADYIGPECQVFVPRASADVLARWNGTLGTPGGADLSSVDRCPDNPYKLAPGACGCAVGDEDGDGIEDCLEELFHIAAFDWARTLDVYENLNGTVDRVAAKPDSRSGRHVARLGVSPQTFSDAEFNETVILEAIFSFDSVQQLVRGVPEPKRLFTTALVLNATGGPVRTPFEPPLRICLRRLRTDVERNLLCLAEWVVADNAWECVDRSLVAFKSPPRDTDMLCGEVDHFGVFVVLELDEVSALRRVLNTAVYSAADSTGLSPLATAAIVAFGLICGAICVSLCCVATGRRLRRRRDRRQDDADVPLKQLDTLNDDSDDDEVAAFRSLHRKRGDDVSDGAFQVDHLDDEVEFERRSHSKTSRAKKSRGTARRSSGLTGRVKGLRVKIDAKRGVKSHTK